MTSSEPAEATAALADAARRALRAPSLLNTQPWRWRVRADRLEPPTPRRNPDDVVELST